MSISILPRRLLGVVLLLKMVAGTSADDPKNDKALDADKIRAEFQKVREILASVDELPPQKARWVKVQVGAAKDVPRHQGWIVSETADAIELLDESGCVSVLSKKKLAAKAPAEEFGTYDVRAVAAADFAAYCREALTRKKEPNKDDDGIGAYRMSREIYDAQREIMLFARLASWARETGNVDLANECRYRSGSRPLSRPGVKAGVVVRRDDVATVET